MTLTDVRADLDAGEIAAVHEAAERGGRFVELDATVTLTRRLPGGDWRDPPG